MTWKGKTTEARYPFIHLSLQNSPHYLGYETYSVLTTVLYQLRHEHSLENQQVDKFSRFPGVQHPHAQFDHL